jgi:hypothetical protein
MNNQITFSPLIFEFKNVQINLTKICQHFNKNISDWTKTKQTKAFLTSFANTKNEMNICISVKDSDSKQGT